MGRHAVALSLLGMLLGAAPAGARVITTILDAAGDGSGPRFPLEPGALAVAPDGTTFVADVPADRVLRVDTAGAVSVVIGPGGDGMGNALDEPSGLALDGAGNLFVAGWASDNVFRVTPSGVVSLVMDASGDGAGTPLDTPNGLATNPAGELFVLSEDTIFRVSAGGAVSVLAPTPRDRAAAIATDSVGNAYVTFTDDWVYRFAPDGTATQLIGPSGVLTEPRTDSITVDADDFVYASGLASGNVLRFSPDGTFVEVVEQFSQPRGVAVDGAGNLFVAGGSSILRRAPDGTETFLPTSAGPGQSLTGAGHVEVDAAGNVYVAGSLSDDVLRVAPDGTVTELIHRNWDTSTHPLEGPDDVVVDGAGNVYVSAVTGDDVFRITPGGAVSVVLDATGDGAGAVLRNPTDLAVDGSGTLFVLGRDSFNVFRVPPGGPPSLAYAASGSIVGMTADAAGNVYAVHLSGEVRRIDPGGTVTTVAAGAGHAEAVAVTPDGTIWVNGIADVYRVDPGGTTTALLGGAIPFRGGRSIVVDDVGRVYAVSLLPVAVVRIDPSGTAVVLIDETGDGLGNTMEDAPDDLAVDGAGNLYVRAPGALFRVTQNGHVALLSAAAAGELMGVAVDASGDVYVTGLAPDTLSRVGFACPAVPATGCRRSTRSMRGNLLARDKSPDARDGVRWKWLVGEATTLADLGNPLATDDYLLCAYDESEPTPLRLFEAAAAAGGTCGPKPCWKALGSRGFQFNDKLATRGIARLVLKAGEDGKAKIVLKADGEALLLPGPPYTPPLRVQLVREGGPCWEASYLEAGVVKNEPAQFRGRPE